MKTLPLLLPDTQGIRRHTTRMRSNRKDKQLVISAPTAKD
jgi:hypothetical protein